MINKSSLDKVATRPAILPYAEFVFCRIDHGNCLNILILYL